MEDSLLDTALELLELVLELVSRPSHPLHTGRQVFESLVEIIAIHCGCLEGIADSLEGYGEYSASNTQGHDDSGEEQGSSGNLLDRVCNAEQDAHDRSEGCEASGDSHEARERLGLDQHPEGTRESLQAARHEGRAYDRVTHRGREGAKGVVVPLDLLIVRAQVARGQTPSLAELTSVVEKTEVEGSKGQ